jgi:hypothetical protein
VLLDVAGDAVVIVADVDEDVRGVQAAGVRDQVPYAQSVVPRAGDG